MRLANKVAAITGAGSGMGKAMAEMFSAEGAKVVCADISGKQNDVAAAIGSAAAAVHADVSEPADVQNMVSAAEEKFGRLDILVNNAGMNIRKPVENLALAEWRQVIDVNLTSAFLASRACYPVMKKQRGGKIINIGSMMSIFGASFAPAYAASKGGMVQLTKAMAAGWAADNIQVNAVLPGWIDTELTQRARQQIEGLHESVERRTPAKRWGVEQDMAGVAVFLASPASDFVTGAAITVDGGYSIQG